MQVQTLNISLPKNLVKEVDAMAKKDYRSRSELIKDLLRIYLQKRKAWEEIFAYGQAVGKKMGIKSEEDVYRIVKEHRRANRAAKSSS